MKTKFLIDLIFFITYLVPQAFFINGIFLAASGHTEIRPDGTEHNSEMIFYPLAKYLAQKKMEKIYYQGDQLTILLKNIILQFPTLLDTENNALTDDQLIYWGKQRKQIQIAFDILIDIDPVKKTVLFYREYSVYRFSKYIRKPIFGCVICMGSFWSIFTFLIPGLLMFKYDLIIVALYIPNATCLAYLNYKINKPL